MQKSGKLYHKMQSKSIQCPADSDEEHSAQYAEQAKADSEAAYADEEAPLPTSVRPAEHKDENQIVSSELSMVYMVGSFRWHLQTNWLVRNAGSSTSVLR